MAVAWTVTVSPAERLARILLGVFGTVAGVYLLPDAAGVLATTLEVSLVIAGLDLAVTGALGHCPLCAKAGHVPVSLKGRNP